MIRVAGFGRAFMGQLGVSAPDGHAMAFHAPLAVCDHNAGWKRDWPTIQSDGPNPAIVSTDAVAGSEWMGAPVAGWDWILRSKSSVNGGECPGGSTAICRLIVRNGDVRSSVAGAWKRTWHGVLICPMLESRQRAKRMVIRMRWSDMRWSEVRQLFPNQFVLVQALKSHQDGDRLYVDEMAVIRGSFSNRSIAI